MAVKNAAGRRASKSLQPQPSVRIMPAMTGSEIIGLFDKYVMPAYGRTLCSVLRELFTDKDIGTKVVT